MVNNKITMLERSQLSQCLAPNPSPSSRPGEGVTRGSRQECVVDLSSLLLCYNGYSRSSMPLSIRECTETMRRPVERVSVGCE